MYNNEFKTLFNQCMFAMIKQFMKDKTPFTLLVPPHVWNKPVPENLQGQEYFMIQIQEQTMDMSYVSEDTIVIHTRFGEDDYNAVLFAEDIGGVLNISMSIPLMIKPFKDSADEVVLRKNEMSLSVFKQEDLTDGVKHSVSCFVRNNPDMFNDQGSNDVG